MFNKLRIHVFSLIVICLVLSGCTQKTDVENKDKTSNKVESSITEKEEQQDLKSEESVSNQTEQNRQDEISNGSASSKDEEGFLKEFPDGIVLPDDVF